MHNTTNTITRLADEAVARAEARVRAADAAMQDVEGMFHDTMLGICEALSRDSWLRRGNDKVDGLLNSFDSACRVYEAAELEQCAADDALRAAETGQAWGEPDKLSTGGAGDPSSAVFPSSATSHTTAHARPSASPTPSPAPSSPASPAPSAASAAGSMSRM